ncbi:DMT family transporter [Breoghania sp.]|uniref:DMT family transporter n=1 Tax=Breoghania sp. TaxID=2065378 RepID=UPI002AAB2C34|nr:DMT family transporter [Breoghania sp.]
MTGDTRKPGRAAVDVDRAQDFTPEQIKARLAGILLIVVTVAFFSVLDTTAKYLSQELPTLQVVWFRFTSHFVMAIFFFRVWKRRHILHTKRPVLQVVRSLGLLGTTIFNFMALRYLQLSDTVTIMFAGPLLVTALAGPVLGEWAGRRRWTAIGVGFLGVLIVTRPGLGGLHWAVSLSLAAMICYAVYALTTRILTETDSVDGMLLISGAVASLAMTPVVVTVWETPQSLGTWALLCSTGFFGGFGHWLLTKAHAIVPAPVLAPFFYSQIVWMVALGYIVFGDVPGFTTILGASVIVGSGLYLLYRERQLNRSSAPVPKA